MTALTSFTQKNIITSVLRWNNAFQTATKTMSSGREDVGQIIRSEAFMKKRIVLPTAAYAVATTDEQINGYFDHFCQKDPRWVPTEGKTESHFGTKSAVHFGDTTFEHRALNEGNPCEFARIIELDEDGIEKASFLHSIAKKHTADDAILLAFGNVADDLLEKEGSHDFSKVVTATLSDANFKKDQFKIDQYAKLPTQDGAFTVHSGHVSFVKEGTLQERRFSFIQNEDGKILDARYSKNPQQPEGKKLTATERTSQPA